MTDSNMYNINKKISESFSSSLARTNKQLSGKYKRNSIDNEV